METAIKPQKRNPNLVPLSREHHFGLLFSWKIKQGLANSIPLDLIRQYVISFWQNNLMQHLETEDKLVPNILAEDHKLLIKFQREHLLIRDLIGRVEANDALTTLLFEALHTLVTEHIRFEERELFPYLQQIASPEQLAKIGNLLLEENHLPLDDFLPAFWEAKKRPVCY